MESKHSSNLQSQGDGPSIAQRLTQYAVDRCSTPITWIDSAGKILQANEAECDMLGYTQDQMQGLSVADIDPNWPREAWPEGWKRLKSAGVATFETEHRHQDGRLFPVEVTTNYLEHDREGYLFVVVTDISARKRAELALKESETKLKAIFDHHYQLTGLLDREGRLIAANKTALEFAGVSESDALGQVFADTPWWLPEDRDQLRGAIKNAAEGKFVRFECVHRRWDGELRDFDFSLSPVHDEDGQVVYLVPEGRDITEVKHAEARLRNHDAMVRDLVESSRDWIWSIDLLGRHTYSNAAVESILGYEPDELVGKPNLPLIHEEDRAVYQETIERLISTHRGWNGLVLRWRHQNGHYRFLESNAVPILNHSGNLIGFRGVDRDITDRVDAEEKLSGMEAQLAHVARLSAIGEMTAGVTHEVMQPLYAISNFAHAMVQTLNDDPKPNLNDIREWCEAIVESANRAETIVHQMRKFSRRGESQKADCQLNEIIEESVQLVAFDARRRGVRVRHTEPAESPCVHAERVQIQQVLVNLLRNAFEAMDLANCEERKVLISLEELDDEVRVSVKDTGPGLDGIGEKDVFEPFQTTKENGLGLGLAISTSIIEAHGGELRGGSVKEGGAIFQFTLPKVAATAV